MDTERLRQLAEQFERVGVGGLFTGDDMRELVSLAIEAADALEQAAPVSAWEPVNPVSMANDEYADAEIMLCYRRPDTAAGEEV